jgi:hypothetical protein
MHPAAELFSLEGRADNRRAGASTNVIQMLWDKGSRGAHLCTVCARDFGGGLW